ncbi:DUF262 domain-containing protein [Peribacillus sp. Hz7]|uniref:DUF262 domain-containing protein n=1 Tax=Peribacillus sp. Hz7 TaxID=3344873 RepID=UPI0035C9E4D3
MQFTQRTILGLFDSSQKKFVIPVYQRAYSWEKDEWQTFLNDLLEQIKGDNHYYYGNLLLETIKKDREYDIIDGQQRITTLTIFIRALIDAFKFKQDSGKDIPISLEDKEKIYLKNNGNIKLRPVEYDRACYDSLIIEGNASFETNTPSQKRIRDAKSFFTHELKKKDLTTLVSILDVIESTEINCIELQGKKDSALMFELQNNRGKDLTNLEKLKSYFMYQIYVHSVKEETDSNIEAISNVFKHIYTITNDIKINEDSVLMYHCYAYTKQGYNYRTLDDIKSEYKASTDKVKWIKNFAAELHTSFSNMKKLEQNKDEYLIKIRNLGMPAFVYPFLIKGMKFSGDNNQSLSKLFNLLEILVFRYKLINSRADINSRLNRTLLDFTGDLLWLKNSFKTKLNEAWYWGDYRVKEYLDGYMYDSGVLSYLLWSYEDFIQSRGYSIGNCSILNQQIEHISPQTPNNKGVEAGYEVDIENSYSEQFVNEYLNCLGNLMLISGSHNASIGNRPFVEKLDSYNSNPLLKQQAEIKNFISGTVDFPIWDSESINKRHKKLVDFAVKNWSFESVEL